MLHRIRTIRRLLGVLATLAATGCVTEQVGNRGPNVEFLVFDGALEGGLYNAGAYHGVELIFEIDPKTDVPPNTPQPSSGYAVVSPTVVGQAFVYEALGGHEVLHDFGEFSVAGFKYDSKGGGKLYVFKTRPGDFEFRFRGHPVRIVSRSRWKPSILFRQEKERGPGGEIVALHETVQIGFATIETDSRWDHWKVDGDEYRPSPRGRLEIGGAVDFGVE